MRIRDKGKTFPSDAGSLREGDLISIYGLDHICVGELPEGGTVIVPDWSSPIAKYVPLPTGAGLGDWALLRSNIEKNRPHIVNSVKHECGFQHGAGRKAIIAGAGPSLQIDVLKSLHFMKCHTWDVFACNSAHRYLEGRATFFCMMDAQHIPSMWEYAREDRNAILCVHVDPAACKGWGSVWWFALHPPRPEVPANQEFTEKIGTLFEQFNITMTMFSLCYAMGYKTIVFVGCDFCMGADGITHAGGERIGPTQGHQRRNEQWAREARAHEAAAWFLHRAGIMVWNCTEGGIMTGMPCGSLKDLLNVTDV